MSCPIILPYIFMLSFVNKRAGDCCNETKKGANLPKYFQMRGTLPAKQTVLQMYFDKKIH